MSVATLELCRELYELSGWQSGNWHIIGPDESTPSYDLGYLLRKLPRIHKRDWHLFLQPWTRYGTWYCNLRHWQDPYLLVEERASVGDTPEDAAAKLAIELFKQGVLTQEAKS